MKELFDAIISGAAAAQGVGDSGLYLEIGREKGVYSAHIRVGYDDVAPFVAHGPDPIAAVRALGREIAGTMSKKADELAGRGSAFASHATALRTEAGES